MRVGVCVRACLVAHLIDLLFILTNWVIKCVSNEGSETLKYKKHLSHCENDYGTNSITLATDFFSFFWQLLASFYRWKKIFRYNNNNHYSETLVLRDNTEPKSIDRAIIVNEMNAKISRLTTFSKLITNRTRQKTFMIYVFWTQRYKRFDINSI